jgi:chloramphenicol-sensitive protein RarD
MENSRRNFRLGVICAIVAHTMWGLFPIYWRQLGHVASIELVWHRIVWSFLLLSIVVPLMMLGNSSGFATWHSAVTNAKNWRVYGAAAIAIAVNWFAFIWAINHNRVIEASLGYYINPLLNVLLGVVVLREHLIPIQWIAVSIAAIGVTIMSVAGGSVPWVAFAMAGTFSTYGLIKKQAKLPPLVGLWMELAVLFIPAAVVLGTKASDGTGAMNGSTTITKMLLIGGGLVTVAPLTLFAIAVRRVDLSLVGILQYIGPTLQFLVGAFLFGEPLDQWRIVGFIFVWIALVTFIVGPGLVRRLCVVS